MKSQLTMNGPQPFNLIIQKPLKSIKGMKHFVTMTFSFYGIKSYMKNVSRSKTNKPPIITYFTMKTY